MPSTIPIFFALFFSPSCVALSPVFPRVEPRAPCIASACCWPDLLGASLHDGYCVGPACRLTWCTTSPTSPRCPVGVHRRLYDTDWQQEGAQRPSGPLSRRRLGESVNAEAR